VTQVRTEADRAREYAGFSPGVWVRQPEAIRQECIRRYRAHQAEVARRAALTPDQRAREDAGAMERVEVLYGNGAKGRCMVSIKQGDTVRLNKGTLPIQLSDIFGEQTFTLVGTVRTVVDNIVAVEWPRPFDQATYLEAEHLTLAEKCR